MKQDLFPSIEDENLANNITTTLEEIQASVKNQVGVRITEKLNRLYNGIICLPDYTQRYINLSSHELSEAQIEVL